MYKNILFDILFAWLFFVLIYGFFLNYIKKETKPRGQLNRALVAGFLYAPKFWTIWVTIILVTLFNVS